MSIPVELIGVDSEDDMWHMVQLTQYKACGASMRVRSREGIYQLLRKDVMLAATVAMATPVATTAMVIICKRSASGEGEGTYSMDGGREED